ncbi:MAG: TerB family tellurite resistance protein [Planctomycetia bacterium]|nr:TerB family tellurite resistance protein [Planctomycetia bacterium]
MKAPVLKTDKEVAFHLFALKRLALADKTVLDSEKDCIYKIANLYKIVLSMDCSLDELVAQLDMTEEEFEAGLAELKSSPQRAKLLIKDLVTTGLADNDYCEEERAMVSEVGRKVGLHPSLVHEIEFTAMRLNRAMRDMEVLIGQS